MPDYEPNVVLSNQEFNVVGTSPIRHDGMDKVTGRARYGVDTELPGMLVGKVLRSPHPHARIAEIDTAAAKRTPGVRAVLTWDDIPQVRWGHEIKDQTALAADRVRFAGEEVAAVAAVDEETAAQGIELVDFDTLLARSDAISIHCPLNDETRGLFDAEVLSRMKPASVLINTARGGIIVESDLSEALQNGPLAAAGLDVFEQEPASPDNPLFALENIVVSPHLAGADTTSIQDMANEAADCIATLYEGNWPGPAVVNSDVQAAWSW